MESNRKAFIYNQWWRRKEGRSPKLNLKPLPIDFKYAYLEDDKFPVVISSKLSYQQETSLLEVLRKCKEANEIASINHSMQWKAKEKPVPLINDEEAKKEESPKLNLNPLPNDLKYAYLEEDKYLMVISSKLLYQQETSLLEVLRKCKEAIGWSIFFILRG